MVNIFLIDGVSGTGKSDLIEYARSSRDRCGIIVKTTTRELRDYEQKESTALDLIFCSREEFDTLQLEYRYEHSEHLYGFSREQLNRCITQSDNIFVIIRSVPLIKRLKEEYKHHRVVAVYIHSDLRLIEERLRRQGRTQSQINFRLSRIKETFSDYVKNSNTFDNVIVNSSDKKDFYTLIDNLLNKYSSQSEK